MGKVIVFANQKGGVGKTTSCINIGAYVALAGKKVLLIDFDSQGNMSSGVGIRKDKPTVYEFIYGNSTAQDTVKHSSIPSLDVISASVDLAGATIELSNPQDKETYAKRNFFLKEALAPLKDSYDYIFIDCPPSLGILTYNGLAAADSVLVPMQCEFFAIEGISQLMETIRRVQSSINPGLTLGGVFFTMYDSRTRLAQEVITKVKAYFKDFVFSTIIPRNIRLSEAPAHGKPICLYDPRCAGAKGYEKLAGEVMARG